MLKEGLQMAVMGASLGLIGVWATQKLINGLLWYFASGPADVRRIGRVPGCGRNDSLLGARLARGASGSMHGVESGVRNEREGLCAGSIGVETRL